MYTFNIVNPFLAHRFQKAFDESKGIIINYGPEIVMKIKTQNTFSCQYFKN